MFYVFIYKNDIYENYIMYDDSLLLAAHVAAELFILKRHN